MQQQHKKSAKVATSNSFGTIHIPIADAEWTRRRSESAYIRQVNFFTAFT